MVLYNITFRVDTEIVNDFKSFIKDYHVPSLQKDENIVEQKFLRLLNVDETDSVTMTLQYILKDLNAYNAHIISKDSKFKQQLSERYGEQVLYFCSLLENI